MPLLQKKEAMGAFLQPLPRAHSIGPMLLPSRYLIYSRWRPTRLGIVLVLGVRGQDGADEDSAKIQYRS